MRAERKAAYSDKMRKRLLPLLKEAISYFNKARLATYGGVYRTHTQTPHQVHDIVAI